MNHPANGPDDVEIHAHYLGVDQILADKAVCGPECTWKGLFHVEIKGGPNLRKFLNKPETHLVRACLDALAVARQNPRFPEEFLPTEEDIKRMADGVRLHFFTSKRDFGPVHGNKMLMTREDINQALDDLERVPVPAHHFLTSCTMVACSGDPICCGDIWFKEC